MSPFPFLWNSSSLVCPVNLVIWGNMPTQQQYTSLQLSPNHCRAVYCPLIPAGFPGVHWLLYSLFLFHLITTYVNSSHTVNLGINRLSFAHMRTSQCSMKLCALGWAAQAAASHDMNSSQAPSLPPTEAEALVNSALSELSMLMKAEQGEVSELSPWPSSTKKMIVLFSCVWKKNKFNHSLEIVLPFFLLLLLTFIRLVLTSGIQRCVVYLKARTFFATNGCVGSCRKLLFW